MGSYQLTLNCLQGLDFLQKIEYKFAELAPRLGAYYLGLRKTPKAS